MTSRLKHKLELDQINTKSAYLNESFVQIGTPLPALADTKRDKLEYVPEWKQEVRDEQGRRRFHGAFTGGFSAGYFNSVGSKEGWTPSTFKSSRSNRAQKAQRPEDFMDEEDLQQMKEERKLENTDIFQEEAFAGTRKPPEDNLPSALESLIMPTQSTIGAKILQKLGWRAGQGIGPRVTLRKLRLQQGRLAHTPSRVRSENGRDDEEEGDEAGKHTFAPRDVKLLVYDPKEDKHGLGFQKGRGIVKLPAGPTYMDKDDDDPYAIGPSSSSRLAFEHEDENDDVVVMGGLAKPGISKGTRSVGKAADNSQDRWHDGRLVLIGFMLDPKGVPQDKWFPFPDVPANWRPRPARVWGTTRKWDEQSGQKLENKSVISGVPGKSLTHEQRGAALGEERRTLQAKSIFEYLSEKDRERLASVVESVKAQPPAALSIEPVPEITPRPAATEVEIPPLSPRTASAALKGFIPYGDDPAKQERYKSYLLSQTYNTKQPNPSILPSSSIDQINTELQSFASSARIFKPMSFAMSSRFTSASSSLATSDMKQARPGLHIYDTEKAKAEMEKPKEEDEVKVREKHLTPREQAANDGLYGKMTRETRQWYPVKLVCRRFGVQDPHPEGPPALNAEIAGKSSTDGKEVDALPLPANDSSWESKFIYQESSSQKSTTQSSTLASASELSGDRVPKSLAEVGMADDINQGRDTLTYTKPSIDIFQAVFADDEEDEVEDELDTKEEGGEAAEEAKTMVGVDPFPPRKLDEEGTVDLTTFKPVFTPRNKDKDKKSREEKKGEKKEKKKQKSVLSFSIGDEGEEEQETERVGARNREREEKKRKRARALEEDVNTRNSKKSKVKHEMVKEEQDMKGEWVEKLVNNPRMAGRKGAADFM
ncbi:hypothetical protein L204_101392 [Cryptococcus depauperatus]|nr:G patch domain-containing protein 1 [Cryptococcus depauperatus CBS 7855]